MNDHTDKSLFELRQYAVEKDREIERLREALEKIEMDTGCEFHKTHDPCNASIAAKALAASGNQSKDGVK